MDVAAVQSHGYDIGQLLGEGFSGSVFECTDSRQRKLAAKVSGSREGAAAEIRHEALLLRSMCHCNIISVDDIIDDGTQVCFVMERLERDLMDGLQSYVMREHVAMDGLRHVVRQMSAGIQHMHKLSIIHRDIKPENFLVGGGQLTDPDCRIVLADFGSACKLGSNDRLTEQVGTTTYWSPEVYNKRYGFKADVWGLGIVMHCMASNTFPFATEQDVRAKKIQLRRWTSSDCNSLICMMLEKDEEKRLCVDQVMLHPWVLCCSTPEPGDLEAAGTPVFSSCRDMLRPAEQKHSGFSRVAIAALVLWALALKPLVWGFASPSQMPLTAVAHTHGSKRQLQVFR